MNELQTKNESDVVTWNIRMSQDFLDAASMTLEDAIEHHLKRASAASILIGDDIRVDFYMVDGDESEFIRSEVVNNEKSINNFREELWQTQ